MSHTFIDVTVDNGLLLNVIPLCTSNQIQILKKNQSNAYVHDTTPTPTLYNHDRNSVSGWTKCVGSTAADRRYTQACSSRYQANRTCLATVMGHMIYAANGRVKDEQAQQT